MKNLMEFMKYEEYFESQYCHDSIELEEKKIGFFKLKTFLEKS